ncbi:aldehyde oxidase [Sphingobacterium faecium NBRC 15299]|uniref:aldo/keto reductase n=1 Tax=Sphingobacterium faecium TaxID=34087 RepID=UPI000D37E818|nr:aldo/keto reductase [Sphingobacterium faecium]PTX07164.1 aryl-alcohol dehydrogenase-like predicted oxidoreductase [Sphingobacterium faecium]GEM65676.1 aldehyde oxidase [Sphingobacterium faecium NBRC 15299]
MEQNNRRDFLKKGAVFGTTLFGTSTFGIAGCTSSSNNVNAKNEKALDPKQSKTRTLGTGEHGIAVSALGLGCMGMSYHRSFIPDKKAMIDLLRKSPELGLNFYDTAEAYGPLTNEELLGEAVAPFRQDIIIATKFGFKNGKPAAGLDSSPARIRTVVEHALKSLKTDYIDLLYQHRVDPNVTIEDVAGTVKDLIAEGKVKHFGMCEASVDNIRKAHAVQPLTALQSEYSLFTRQPEQDVIKLCEELGIGFVPYSPLSRGMITGYLNERSKYDSNNDNRSTLPRYQPDNVIANWKLIDLLKEFGDHRGLTVAQVALAWLLAQKPFIVPIPGTTKWAHLQENLSAADYVFSSGELNNLTAKIDQIPIVGDRLSGLSAEQTQR